MLQKSFISVSFASPNYIQIVKLSNNNTKLEKAISIELPKGTIVNYKVVDPKTLGYAIGDAFKAYKIKEKFVGLIVPEFSAFLKSIELPSKLSEDELGEALEWQIQEFLPKDASLMSFDWKVIGKSNDDYQILAVAIENEVLGGYVKSIEHARLIPLVVETPSLSLVRVVRGSKDNRLVIYSANNKSILALCENEKIIASSVVSSSDPDVIKRTVSQMLDHYKSQTSPEEIVFAGLDVTDKLADIVSKELSIPHSFSASKVKNLNPEKYQEYIIPISLQFKDPSEPADIHTINLLPRHLADLYKKERLRLQVWSLTLAVSLFVWASFLATLATSLFMDQQIGPLKLNSNNVNKAQLARSMDITQRVNEANDYSTRTISIYETFVYPQDILNVIYEAKSEGISLADFSFNFEKGEMEVVGVANTRRDLIDFKDKLEQQNGVSETLIPISNFESESNLEFSLKFLYQKNKSVNIPIAL